jgi:hypothetical protein
VSSASSSASPASACYLAWHSKDRVDDLIPLFMFSIFLGLLVGGFGAQALADYVF